MPLAQEYKDSDKYDKKKSLAEIIEKPIWIKEYDVQDGQVIEVKPPKKVNSRTYKPDAICIYKKDKNLSSNDMNNYTFVILDAKYYVFDMEDIEKDNNEEYKFDKGTHPGIEDITKQFMYQQAYNAFIQECGYGKVCNVFLSPTDKKTHRF